MIEQAKTILQSTFGYSTFRPLQEEIISHVFEKKDALVLMPTGGGKSMCFQIPGLILDGTALVVSPLISLMRDQVEALKHNGVAAAYYNSSLTSEEEREVLLQAQNGKLKFLYVSPERLMAENSNWIRGMNISLVAIDEAHCISMWGHDFRPEYQMLSTFRSTVPEIPFLALTATADRSTRKDIASQLGLKDPKTFLSSFNRGNLRLEVRSQRSKKQKEAEILSFLTERKGESGIVYCLSRKNTNELAAFLRNNGLDAQAYHAGLSAEERNRVQENFIKDDLSIVCATIAFGMGIDKSNVRWVIHSNMPKNLEGYYQEIGRAGRDGLPSDTLLFYALGDFMTLSTFARDSVQSELQLAKLQRMLEYAEATTCRRRVLLSYFSEYLEEPCGNCDVCDNPPKTYDALIPAQKVLSAVIRTKEKVGATMVTNILRGSSNAELLAKGFHEIKTYGVGKEYSFKEWKHIIIQLLNQGLLELAYDENQALKVSRSGKEVLKTGGKVHMTHYFETEKPEKVKKKRTSKKEKELSTSSAIFEALRAERKKIAMQENVPAYLIFNDNTLQEMASMKPNSILSLRQVSGVGEHKAEAYGEQFLSVLRSQTGRGKNGKPTFEVSYDLYQTGKTVDEIAEERGLQVTTVFSHLATAVSVGKELDVSAFLEESDIERVLSAAKAIGESQKLRPIFDRLEESIPFHRIRLALSVIERDSLLEEQSS
jgi:ATP-dependent DNA helicase RecQ